MKVVVVGGSGLIGSRLVARLRERGHEVVPASPSTGVDALTGRGVAEALAGAQVVVDVTNSPSFAPDDVLAFFRTSTTTLLAAERAAGVGHHVALSIVGTDRAPDSGYLRAKLAQEELVAAGGVPHTVLRATQFFEFLRGIADASTESGTGDGTGGDTVRVTDAHLQPVAADDVVDALAELATGAPVDGVVEVAGPEPIGLDELVRRVLAADGDPRRVVADRSAGYFGARIDDGTLVPGPGARIGAVSFADWLAKQS
jgi:uncharacterized protein YbjT (DUF2867 family)